MNSTKDKASTRWKGVVSAFAPARIWPAILDLAPWLVLLVFFLVHHLLKWEWFYAASDDSYIYLGYVKMLLGSPHELFSYNPGEPSGGTTGILYYYALIAVGALTRVVTFGLPLAESLTLAMYVLNSTLFLGLGLLVRAIWFDLTTASTLTRRYSLWMVLLLLCTSWKFLWGEFAGLENPLSTFLTVLLLYQFLLPARWWTSCITAAALVVCRPELGVVMGTIPLLSAWTSSRASGRTDWRRLATRVPAGLALWGGVLGLLVAPFYLKTGNVFPSSLGSRVEIGGLANPAQLWANLSASFTSTNPWKSGWMILILSVSVGLIGLLPHRRVGVLLGAVLVVASHFAVRAALGLRDFNVADRYVSYLWVIPALGLATILEPLWLRIMERTGAVGRYALPAFFALAIAVVPLRTFFRIFNIDVAEMNQVVVEPSRWMAKNIPPGSRVAMEPAGAIRLFTDHYLIDAVGLTTSHFRDYKGTYLGFLLATKAQYVFDYPNRHPVLNDPKYFDQLARFEPDVPHYSGLIGVHKFIGVPGVRLAAIRFSDSDGDNSNPVAAFDNDFDTNRAVRPGYWYAGKSLPALLEATFERVVIGGVGLKVWGRSFEQLSPPGRHLPRVYRFDALVDGKWMPMTIKDREIKTEPDGREIWVHEFTEMKWATGIRFICPATYSEYAPVINELFLTRDRHWLPWNTGQPSIKKATF